MISEELRQRFYSLCQKAKSRSSQLSVSVGFIIDALELPNDEMCLGGKSAAALEAAELRAQQAKLLAENERLQAQLAVASTPAPTPDATLPVEAEKTVVLEEPTAKPVTQAAAPDTASPETTLPTEPMQEPSEEPVTTASALEDPSAIDAIG